MYWFSVFVFLISFSFGDSETLQPNQSHLGREPSIRAFDVATHDDVRDEGHQRQVQVRGILVLSGSRELLVLLVLATMICSISGVLRSESICSTQEQLAHLATAGRHRLILSREPFPALVWDDCRKQNTTQLRHDVLLIDLDRLGVRRFQ